MCKGSEDDDGVYHGAQRPVFNVMDPYFNFNITGTMTFDGIAFSGEEAAAKYTNDHYPPINRIPVKKCEVD